MTVIALIDGPLRPDLPAFRNIDLYCDLHPLAAKSPAALHAQQMAAAIRHNAPGARIDNHVVFPGRMVCSVSAICAAIHRAAKSDADILHCSFGLVRNAPELAEAVAGAVRSGKRVVAAAPARGQAVFPAMYDGVISVQGDARCAPDTWSWLDLPHAQYGACAIGETPATSGASTAAARFSGLLAREILAGRAADMHRTAAFHGREHVLGLEGGGEGDVGVRGMEPTASQQLRSLLR